ICVAPGEHLRREHRHRLVAAAAGQYEALLQPRRGLGVARRRLAQAPVPRAGADHPVLAGHLRVREIHVAHRGRGHDAVTQRALAVIDGEHYAPVVRDALRELPYDVVAAVLVGGTEKLRGGEDYGVPLAAGLEEAIADHRPELVLDLSDEPVLDPPSRFRLAGRGPAEGLPAAGGAFRFA